MLIVRGKGDKQRSRSPHGERGLKYVQHQYQRPDRESLSSWRAWIEIMQSCCHGIGSAGRSPHGERGLKCIVKVFDRVLTASLSSWRAWIEMRY